MRNTCCLLGTLVSVTFFGPTVAFADVERFTTLHYLSIHLKKPSDEPRDYGDRVIGHNPRCVSNMPGFDEENLHATGYMKGVQRPQPLGPEDELIRRSLVIVETKYTDEYSQKIKSEKEAKGSQNGKGTSKGGYSSGLLVGTHCNWAVGAAHSFFSERKVIVKSAQIKSFVGGNATPIEQIYPGTQNPDPFENTDRDKVKMYLQGPANKDCGQNIVFAKGGASFLGQEGMPVEMYALYPNGEGELEFRKATCMAFSGHNATVKELRDQKDLVLTNCPSRYGSSGGVIGRWLKDGRFMIFATFLGVYNKFGRDLDDLNFDSDWSSPTLAVHLAAGWNDEDADFLTKYAGVEFIEPNQVADEFVEDYSASEPKER